jgi:hypothetical protein
MPTLAALVNERRAKIDAFDYDLYDGRADIDISGLRREIERTPVNSKADALAALDLIHEEAKKREPDLIIKMVIALRKYVETLQLMPNNRGSAVPGSEPSFVSR